MLKQFRVLSFLIVVILIQGCQDDQETFIPTPEQEACAFEAIIPTSIIHDRLDLNEVYGFFSCYHTPLNVTLSDTTSCIFSFNKSPQVQSYGFYFFDLQDSLVSRQFGAQILDPVWSPDGNWLMWSNNENIYKMPFRGDTLDYDQVVQLTDDNAVLIKPIWSPLQQQVLFESVQADENSIFNTRGYYLMNQDGSDAEFLFDSGEEVFWKNEGEIFVLQGNAIKVFNLFLNEFQEVSEISNDYRLVRNLKLNPLGSSIYFLARFQQEETLKLFKTNLSDGATSEVLAGEVIDYEFVTENEILILFVKDRISQIGLYNSLNGNFEILYNYRILR